MVEYKSVEEFKELRDIPEYKHLYFFEVQHRDKKGKYNHVGYMNRLFATEEDAAAYYAEYNPTLRPLNTNQNNTSSCNTKTNLRYKLHIYGSEDMTVPSWDRISSTQVWSSNLFSPLGQKVYLGKVMTKGINKAVAEFPLCPARSCWCYDCSLTYSKLDGIDSEYTEEQYRLCALRNAKEARQKYLDSCIPVISLLNPPDISSSSRDISNISIIYNSLSSSSTSSNPNTSILSPSSIPPSSNTSSSIPPSSTSSSITPSTSSSIPPSSIPPDYFPPPDYPLDEKEATSLKVDSTSVINPSYFSMTGVGFSENEAFIIVDIKSSLGNYLCEIPLISCKKI